MKDNLFKVDDKNNFDMAYLLREAGEKYASESRELFAGSYVGTLIKKVLPNLILQKANINIKEYKIEGSIGKGQYAEVAWISIFDKSITTSATKGIYIVFLFSVDGKSLYLSLNQGYTYFKTKFREKEARNQIIRAAEIIRSCISFDDSKFIDSIHLGAKNSLGKGYEAGHIIGVKYDFDNMPSDKEIVQDIIDLVSIYKSIKILFSNRSIEQFYDFLVAENQGLIQLNIEEEEVNTSNAGVVEFTEIIDEPKAKKFAVYDNKGVRRFPRDSKVASRALIQGNYLCAYDNSHFTFKANGSENMYVEAHHLIPIGESDKFNTSIDVEANIVPLCSVCHDCIHHGQNSEKTKIITKLYNERNGRLKKAGIVVSLEQLLMFYGIKNNH